MKSLTLLISLMGIVTSIPALAGHAKESWPAPVKSYQTGQIMIDRLEVTRTDNDEDVVVWDMKAWYGGDRNRVYFKSEGENALDDGEPSELESAELLASRLIAPFWQLQAGVGTSGSTASDANRENYLVLSLLGIAPYRFEMDSSITVNEDGDIAASMEAEYDLRLTQVSYLQPRLELTAALTDAPDYERPSGFNSVRLGFRYRYELAREFAPYVGVYWSRALGDKAALVREGGDEANETGIVVGARMWF